MIKIKDYIFNENEIKMFVDGERIKAVFKNDTHIYIDAEYEDIEWNYENIKENTDEYIKLSNEYHILEKRNKELEKQLGEEKKAWKDMLDSRDKLCNRISKGIEYIEELYTRYIADYSDIERLEKILKGEENESN